MSSQSKPNVISTFSGCGGSSLGYKLAGFNVALAVEFDDDAVKTYRANFSDTTLFAGDIKDLSVDKCIELSGIQPGELDVFDGSPPCQGFSTIGKRVMNDSRNRLFEQYIRLLKGMKPKVFVMENVSGMVKGKMKLIFAEIMNELKRAGYNVKAKLLNAGYFNVPQSRPRLIFIGVRNDLKIKPSFPKAKSGIQTVRQALRNVSLEDDDHRMLPDSLTELAKYQPKKWSTDKTLFQKITKHKGGYMSLQWSEWDKPVQTIVKSEIGVTGIVHPDRKRYFSMNELKRLASFPDDFEFFNRKNAISRIGNCVPPNFMKEIALNIKQQILD